MFDIDSLKSFNLTTPELEPGTTDEARTYGPGEFPNNEFFSYDASGFRVSAPTKAAGTTANSNRSRCELREVTLDGRAFNFQLDSFKDNVLDVALTVERMPKEGRTTVGQIHVKNNTRPLLKLFHDDEGVIASFRAEFNQKNPVNYPIVPGVPVGEHWSYKIHVKQDGDLTITVSAGGTDTTLTLKVADSWRSQLLYFKCGTYIQEDANESTLESEGSTIFFDGLKVFHGELPVAVEPTPYDELITELSELESTYYSDLKKLQSPIKTSLNEMTTRMKSLPDKDLLAPIYVAIKAFKENLDLPQN